MMARLALVAALAVSIIAEIQGATIQIKPPKFGPTYTVSGDLYIPEGSIKEPFTAYYDEVSQKSRIDYYGGEQKTFQNCGDEPRHNYKVVWTPNAATHIPEQNCYQTNRTPPQPILPDLTGFMLTEQKSLNFDKTIISPSLPNLGRINVTCFAKFVKNVARFSQYVFCVRQDDYDNFIPVAYIIYGYDSLLGSHFDNYLFLYHTYKTTPIDKSVFDVNSVIDKACTEFPSPPGLSVSHLFNPMKELVHGDDSHVDEHFSHFKNEHNKLYSNSIEERQRRHNFLHNMRFVNSMNRKKLTYTLKLNDRADWSQSEFKMLRGRLMSTDKKSSAKSFPTEKFFDKSTPSAVDWREKGAVTPVKDQAICGSCWSFGTAGHIESQYFLKHGKLLNFSEQQLVDCSWPYGNDGCDGGQDFLAYDYIQKYGLATEDQYGHYRGIDGKCKDLDVKNKPIQTLKGYVNVTGVKDLLTAIANVGPITVSMDASRRSFSFYASGIYEDDTCSSTELDHLVLAVGYNTTSEPYWIVKNSWSTKWGDMGYFLIAQRDNMCGITTAATYAELE